MTAAAPPRETVTLSLPRAGKTAEVSVRPGVPE